MNIAFSLIDCLKINPACSKCGASQNMILNKAYDCHALASSIDKIDNVV